MNIRQANIVICFGIIVCQHKGPFKKSIKFAFVTYKITFATWYATHPAAEVVPAVRLQGDLAEHGRPAILF